MPRFTFKDAEYEFEATVWGVGTYVTLEDGQVLKVVALDKRNPPLPVMEEVPDATLGPTPEERERHLKGAVAAHAV
ncbi:MAG: hypothetical protein WA021_00255 [Minisyncoccia bacterium]